MAKQKILKIKVGEVYDGKKTLPVFNTAFQKTSKDGKTYYQYSNVVFVQEVETKEKVEVQKVEA
jgi:hypothetical protein